MSLRCGIIGLPNVGKSTLFNALTNANAQVENYAFCTIDPNIGKVLVPDERIEKIREAAGSKEGIQATVEFVDIAGLVKGASRGEGLGNQFLSHVREMDALIHVVRCFQSENVSHVHGNMDPVLDIETVDLELIMKDLETVENRIEKAAKMAKGDNKEYKAELEFLKMLRDKLSEGKKLKDLELKKEDIEYIKTLNLLTDKPVLYVANVEIETLEKAYNSKEYKSLKESLGDEANIVPLNASLEAELRELESEEREEFTYELGIEELGMDRVVKSTYQMLNLITFYTTNEKETRAWPVVKGTIAREGAGKIHTDMYRGFIRAEVINWKDFVEYKGFSKAKEKGLVKFEGKEYVIKDGDVIYFHFKV